MKVIPKGSVPTGEYSVDYSKGSHTSYVFPEKPLKVKPFCAYPYAFINKYGAYSKPIVNPSYVNVDKLNVS